MVLLQDLLYYGVFFLFFLIIRSRIVGLLLIKDNFPSFLHWIFTRNSCHFLEKLKENILIDHLDDRSLGGLFEVHDAHNPLQAY